MAPTGQGCQAWTAVGLPPQYSHYGLRKSANQYTQTEMLHNRIHIDGYFVLNINNCKVTYFPQKQGFFWTGSPKSQVDEVAGDESSRHSPSFNKCRPLSHVTTFSQSVARLRSVHYQAWPATQRHYQRLDWTEQFFVPANTV